MLEVYSRSFVDRLLPYSMEHLWEFKDLGPLISDIELERIGLLDTESRLFEVPEELLNNP